MRTLIATLLIFTSSACLAHEDRIITLNADGSLAGIPVEYGPATLRVNFSQQSARDASIKSIDLTLGENQVHLPICVTGLINTREMSQIRASASWYHDESILPHYLNFDFFDPGYNESRSANSGYKLLFNLHNGRLIRMEALVVSGDGKGPQYVPVDVSYLCGVKMLKGFAHER
jgi:hypothetical protein